MDKKKKAWASTGASCDVTIFIWPFMVIKQRAPDQKNPFASKCMLENKVALPIAFEHHGLLLLEVI
jgi:hypothetical protein